MRGEPGSALQVSKMFRAFSTSSRISAMSSSITWRRVVFDKSMQLGEGGTKADNYAERLDGNESIEKSSEMW